MKRLNFTLIFILFVVFYSCKNEQTSRKDVDSETESIVFNELKQEFQKVYYRFPSPDEMFTYLDSTGLQFDKTLLSSCRNSDNYLGTRDQALNLGIYIADLAYISLFHRYKESDEYLQTIYKLSDKLRISGAFDKNLLSRIEKNIKNNDSLDVISDVALNSIINYLSRNQQEDIFALSSIGGFIEFMNISLHLSNDYQSDNIIVRKIVDHKMVYENMLKFTQQYAENNKNINDVLELNHPLTSFFDHLKTEFQKTTVSKSDEGKLVFSGGNKILLSKNEFDQLKEIIIRIRSQITSANF
jgi:hypothetical protein